MPFPISTLCLFFFLFFFPPFLPFFPSFLFFPFFFYDPLSSVYAAPICSWVWGRLVVDLPLSFNVTVPPPEASTAYNSSARGGASEPLSALRSPLEGNSGCQKLTSATVLPHPGDPYHCCKDLRLLQSLSPPPWWSLTCGGRGVVRMSHLWLSTPHILTLCPLTGCGFLC